jgi:ricin-type beta-trefoil lectin protein
MHRMTSMAALGAGLLAAMIAVPMSPAAADTPNYHFLNYNSAKCADVKDRSTANSAPLQQYSCHSGLNQLFRMTGDWWTDGYFLIISANSGKCLDVRNRSTSDGAVIQQYSCHSGANQQWTITGGPGGGLPVPGNHWYTIRSRYSGKCLEVNGASQSDRAALVQRTCNGGLHQLWAVY